MLNNKCIDDTVLAMHYIMKTMETTYTTIGAGVSWQMCMRLNVHFQSAAGKKDFLVIFNRVIKVS